MPTSNPAVVAAYLKQLFGEERVTLKTRIPGLDTLVNPPRVDSEARTQAARPAALSAEGNRSSAPLSVSGAISEVGTAKIRRMPLSGL